jgi:hypothetical protein
MKKHREKDFFSSRKERSYLTKEFCETCTAIFNDTQDDTTQIAISMLLESVTQKVGDHDIE